MYYFCLFLSWTDHCTLAWLFLQMVERRRELKKTTRKENPKGAAERKVAPGTRMASHHQVLTQGSRASRMVAMEARGWSHIAKNKIKKKYIYIYNIYKITNQRFTLVHGDAIKPSRFPAELNIYLKKKNIFLYIFKLRCA